MIQENKGRIDGAVFSRRHAKQQMSTIKTYGKFQKNRFIKAQSKDNAGFMASIIKNGQQIKKNERD